MLIDWAKLLPALVLLLTPIAWFHGKRVRYRALNQSWGGYWVRALKLGLHVMDLLRAAGGAWLLTEAFQIAPGAGGVLRYATLGAQAGVLCLATTLQTMVCKQHDSAHAPFAFAVGLAAGYLPPLTFAFALVIAFVAAFGARVASLFLPVFAVAILLLGRLLNGASQLYILLMVGCAIALPWLLCLLFPRTMVASYRVKHSDDALPSRR